jgi:hypothetical protein
LILASGCQVAENAVADKADIREDGWSLYRGSVIDTQARVYIATFDSLEKDYEKSGPSYNQTNCEIAENLFENQTGITVDYWCEPQTDRVSSYAN